MHARPKGQVTRAFDNISKTSLKKSRSAPGYDPNPMAATPFNDSPISRSSKIDNRYYQKSHYHVDKLSDLIKSEPIANSPNLPKGYTRDTVTARRTHSGIPVIKNYRPGANVTSYRRSHSNNQYRERPENLPRQQLIFSSQEYPMLAGSGSGGSVTSSLPLIGGAGSNQRAMTTATQNGDIAASEQVSIFGDDVSSRLVQREREELGRMEMAELFGRAEPITRIPLSRMAKLKQLLNLKPISENTYQRYGVCALPTLDGLMFPRYSQTQLVEGDNLRPTGVKIYRLIENNDGMTTATEEILPNANSFNGIFGYHLTKSTDEEAVLVDNELDAMAINQSTGQLALCLPDGTGPLSIDMLPYLEDFLKLTLWVQDEKFNRAKAYARRLIAKRCFLVSPRRGRPLDLVSKRGGADEVRKILRQASEALTKDVDTFASLRDIVRDEMFGTGASTGIAQWKRFSLLNQFFRGFRLGELTLLTGPTGCGKTTFLSEYSLDLCDQNVNTLWCSFEIPNSRLVAMMVQQYGRRDVTKDQSSTSFDFWYEKLMQLPMYFTRFRGTTKMKAVADAIDYHVAAQQIQHVIIDNVQFMLGNAAGHTVEQQILVQESIFSEFRRLATVKNIHITLVIHPRRDEDERDLTPNSLQCGLKGSQEADNVIIIQTRYHRLPEPYHDKYLQIWKNRFFGDLHLGNRLHLIFDPHTKCHNLIWRKKK